jgi:hypothetical protein
MVSVYVPAVVTVVEVCEGVVPAGFPNASVHAKVTFGVLELPLMIADEDTHVSEGAASKVICG